MRNISLVLVVGAVVGVGLCLLVGGCAMTIPLHGQDHAGKPVTGTATNFHGDVTGGTFALKLASGVSCSGVYRYTVGGKGTAPLTCTDGRTGVVDFVSDGFRGSAQGVIGADQGFNLTF